MDWSLFEGRCLTQYEIERLMQQHGIDLEIEEVLNTLDQCPGIIRGEVIECQRCHNQMSADNKKEGDFGEISYDNNRIYYCLNCMQLGRISEKTILYSYPYQRRNATTKRLLTWSGQLSTEQQRASIALVQSLHDERPHLIQAVTGAGKTEMIFEVIHQVLQQGGRVAVATPRMDVCNELAPRLQEAFASVPVILLHGQSEKVYCYTSLVVATTHQMWRFKEAFDLIIVDEVDGFPYAGDPTLHAGVEQAKRKGGKVVYLTATPDSYLNNEIKHQRLTQTILPARYHRFSLPEPKCYWAGDWRQAIHKRRKWSELYRKLKRFKELRGPKLLFIANIALAEQLYQWLQREWVALAIACVHSKDPSRQEKVQQLRDNTLDILITTTILERGVTFTNCQVCIIGAEHPLFTESSLVQMSGRVGRKPDYPTGEVWFLHFGYSKAMRRACAQIKQMNTLARQGGLIDE